MLFNEHFQRLAERAMGGDDIAGAQLRRELEPQMFFIVRHALSSPRTETPLSRTIVAAVRELEPAVDIGRGGAIEPAIRRVAAQLCQRLVDRLCAAANRPNPRDTLQRVFCTLA